MNSQWIVLAINVTPGIRVRSLAPQVAEVVSTRAFQM